MLQNVASLAAQGVPTPIVNAFLQYQTAIDSGLPEPGARVVFQDNFLEPQSPLHAHTDDMIWVVRGQGNSASFFVSLHRRGSQDAIALLEETDHFGSIEPQVPISSAEAGDFGAPDGTPSRSTACQPTDADDDSPSERLFKMIAEKISAPNNVPRRRRAPPILWRDTLLLNILTQWKYSLTVAVVKICEVRGHLEMVAVRREVHRVFGQPTKTVFSSDKEARGSGDVMDYPNMYFNVENFDEEAFRDIHLGEGYSLAVLLTAGDGHTDSNATLFRGVLNYDAIMKRVLKKASEHKYVPTAERKEFIPLLGPERKGKAEIAVCVSISDLECSARLPPQTSKDDVKQNSNFITGLLKKREGSKGLNSVASLRGDEVLHCCLTFVSIPVTHVGNVLSSTERITPKQWLYVPQTRKELDDILEAQQERELQQRRPQPASPTAAFAPQSPSNEVVDDSRRAEGGGGIFASLKRRFMQ